MSSSTMQTDMSPSKSGDGSTAPIDGVGLIARERQRQMKAEGWSREHDDCHEHGELALAAATYAIPRIQRSPFPSQGVPDMWPFDDVWWKPTPKDRVRELVKAGALIAAEIDRLQRVR